MPVIASLEIRASSVTFPAMAFSFRTAKDERRQASPKWLPCFEAPHPTLLHFIHGAEVLHVKARLLHAHEARDDEVDVARHLACAVDLPISADGLGGQLDGDAAPEAGRSVAEEGYHVKDVSVHHQAQRHPLAVTQDPRELVRVEGATAPICSAILRRIAPPVHVPRDALHLGLEGRLSPAIAPGIEDAEGSHERADEARAVQRHHQLPRSLHGRDGVDVAVADGRRGDEGEVQAAEVALRLAPGAQHVVRLGRHRAGRRRLRQTVLHRPRGGRAVVLEAVQQEPDAREEVVDVQPRRQHLDQQHARRRQADTQVQLQQRAAAAHVVVGPRQTQQAEAAQQEEGRPGLDAPPAEVRVHERQRLQWQAGQQVQRQEASAVVLSYGASVGQDVASVLHGEVVEAQEDVQQVQRVQREAQRHACGQPARGVLLKEESCKGGDEHAAHRQRSEQHHVPHQPQRGVRPQPPRRGGRRRRQIVGDDALQLRAAHACAPEVGGQGPCAPLQRRRLLAAGEQQGGHVHGIVLAQLVLHVGLLQDVGLHVAQGNHGAGALLLEEHGALAEHRAFLQRGQRQVSTLLVHHAAAAQTQEEHLARQLAAEHQEVAGTVQPRRQPRRQALQQRDVQAGEDVALGQHAELASTPVGVLQGEGQLGQQALTGHQAAAAVRPHRVHEVHDALVQQGRHAVEVHVVPQGVRALLEALRVRAQVGHEIGHVAQDGGIHRHAHQHDQERVQRLEGVHRRHVADDHRDQRR
eukprot:scaffold803_cov310-Pinguiococcus_pyrenoidosus.AAC.199